MRLVVAEEQAPNLELEMRKLSLEAFVGSNVVENLKSIIPGFTDKLRSFVSGFSDQDELTKRLKQTDSKVSDLKENFNTSQTNMYSVEKVLISVPEGFKGNFLAYLNMLDAHSDVIYKQTLNALNHYNTILSSFITNKDDKISLKDYTDYYIQLERDLSKINDQYTHFFPTDKDLSKNYFGDCVDRISDVSEIVKLADRLWYKCRRHDMRELNQSVAKVVDLLNIVNEQLTTKSISFVTPNAALNLSKGAYALAKYVEFSSIYHYRVEQMVSCACKLVEKMEQVIAK